MYLHVDRKVDNSILDVGCGTGLLGIASEPFLGTHGRYVGIDVVKREIEFCRNHFPSAAFEFIHLDISNPAYTPSQKSERVGWPVKPASFDLVTALSTWTHLNEEDALFYFKEVGRVLKPGGKAIITFFLLDEIYEKGLDARSKATGRYHMTSQGKWVFDQPAYGSNDWFHPAWATVPESAVGVTENGLNRLISEAGIGLVQRFPGNWKEVPGVFFQDVIIFQKS
ncbi:MAG: class I SAM-dependent methyltransferase [Nitrospirota bacterium]